MSILRPWLIALLCLGACSSTQQSVAQERLGASDGPVFEFMSGHPARKDDHGQWSVRVRADAMWIAYARPGRTKEFGTFTLDEAQRDELWALVETANIAAMPPGSPGTVTDVTFFFGLVTADKEVHASYVDRVKAARDPDLRDLVKLMRRLIRDKTGKPAEL